MTGRVPFRIKVAIDGASIDLSQIGFLYQRDPWPAGHRYELRLEGRLPEVIESALARVWASLNDVAGDDVTEFFEAVEWATVPPSMKAPMYFLNSIDDVTQDDVGVVVGGVCSPLMRIGRTNE